MTAVSLFITEKEKKGDKALKKLPSYLLVLVFVFVSACFLTFQITYTSTDKFWKNKIDTMLSAEKADIAPGLSEIADTVRANYLYPTDESALGEGIKDGYVKALADDFSMYLDEEQYKQYLDFENNANNIGIGINTLYDASLDGILVVNVYKGSPAEGAGMVPGDIITGVDGVDVDKIGYYGVMSLLATGTEGETVSISVRKITGSEVVFELSKSAVKSERITGEKLKNNIGLIRINGFESGDDAVFKKVLESLITRDCEKFVIDVRNNSGGNIEAISGMLDFVSPDGAMFTITDKSDAKNTVSSDANSVPYPFAVLVNERTVCGAELFASVLSQNEINKLFGVNTYGKPSVQSVFRLSEGGAVSLSTVKYVPSAGEDFDGVGVTPDEIVALSDEALAGFTTITKEEDAQLQAAIEYLKTQKQTTEKD